MKAIITKYIAATNTKSSRIKASDCDHNSVTISYPHELDVEAAHRLAAKKLCEKLGWGGKLVTGGLKNSYVHTFVDGYPGGTTWEV